METGLTDRRGRPLQLDSPGIVDYCRYTKEMGIALQAIIGFSTYRELEPKKRRKFLNNRIPQQAGAYVALEAALHKPNMTEADLVLPVAGVMTSSIVKGLDCDPRQVGKFFRELISNYR